MPDIPTARVWVAMMRVRGGGDPCDRSSRQSEYGFGSVGVLVGRGMRQRVGLGAFKCLAEKTSMAKLPEGEYCLYRIKVTNWETRGTSTRGTSIWPEAYYSKYTYTWNSRPFCDQDRKCINRRCICLYHHYCTVLEVPVRRVWKRKLEHENFRKNGETEIMWPRSGLRNLFV